MLNHLFHHAGKMKKEYSEKWFLFLGISFLKNKNDWKGPMLENLVPHMIVGDSCFKKNE